MIPSWLNAPGGRASLDIPIAGPGCPRTGIPANCARLVPQAGRTLRALGVAPATFYPPKPTPDGEAPAVPVAAPWLAEGVRLYPWQHEGIQWARGREGTLLQWGTGAGKTLAGWLWGTLGATVAPGLRDPALPVGARYLPNPVVYVTPAKLIPDAIAKIRGYLHPDYRPCYRIFAARGKKNPAISSDPESRPDLVITAWETLQAWAPVLAPWVDAQDAALVMDEIHYVREYSRRVRQVAPSGDIEWIPKNNWSYWAEVLARRAPRRLGMTATPAPKGRHDMWSPLDLVELGAWGSFWDFARRYCDAGPTDYAPLAPRGTSNDAEFTARRDTVVHVVDKTRVAAHLPALTREVLVLGADDLARTLRADTAWAKGARRAGTSPMEVRLSLAAQRKTPWILAQAEDAVAAGLKIAVLTGRKAHAKSMHDAIRESVPAGTTLIYGDGDDSAQARVTAAAHWRTCPAPAVLVGTREAWGTGYDLQDADIVIMAQLPWTWELFAQAEGRFQRPGMSRTVRILYPVAEGTFDERIQELLLASLDNVQQTVIDAEATGAQTDMRDSGKDEELLAGMLLRFCGDDDAD